MTRRRRIIALMILVTAASLASALLAGIGGQRFRGYRPRYAENEPSNTEFVFARWSYESSGGWAHDYPDAEEHINQIMDEATAINVDRMSYKVVPMDSDEIFQ